MDQDLKDRFDAEIEELRTNSGSRLAPALTSVLSLVSQKVGAPTLENSMASFLSVYAPTRIQLLKQGRLIGQIVWTDHKFLVALTTNSVGTFPTKYDIQDFTKSAPTPEGDVDKDDRWVAVEHSTKSAVAHFVALFSDNNKVPSTCVLAVTFNPIIYVEPMILAFINTLNTADVYYGELLIRTQETEFKGF